MSNNRRDKTIRRAEEQMSVLAVGLVYRAAERAANTPLGRPAAPAHGVQKEMAETPCWLKYTALPTRGHEATHSGETHKAERCFWVPCV